MRDHDVCAATVCTGRIAVLSPTPAPETVFQSEPDYVGVTGLWALPARPGDGADALLVLSSVSGSRALSTGARLGLGLGSGSVRGSG